MIGAHATFHAEERHDDLLGGYAVTIDTFVSDRVLRKIDEFNQKALLNSFAKKPYKPIPLEGAITESATGTPEKPGVPALYFYANTA